jgi:TPP-dependent pyruvate/acetoin dehydrogenase alpha subunit
MDTATIGQLDLTTLRRLHREMLRIRSVEEQIAAIYSEQEMRCPVHLCIGQEAVAVGVCAHLTRHDYALSGHRSHGHYLAKGGDLNAMMAEIYGKATGCTSGKGGSMHLTDLSSGFLGAVPIVGSTIPIAVGAAWGSRMRGEGRVVVTFFGEAAVEEGVFHEAINFAAVKRLAVVFVCENNLYSVYTPLSARQPAGHEVYLAAKGHGVWSVQGDGNDIAEVYSLAENAVGRARAGDGPSFLEFKTYRWREHCGPLYDNDLGYRSQDEFEEWRARCPLDRIERHLETLGGMSRAELDEMRRAAAADAGAAIAFAKGSPFPDVNQMMADVYAE